LGPDNYRKLEPRSVGQKISQSATEGRWMRELMKEFDKKKRIFCNDGSSMKIDLPEPLANLNLPGKVEGGEFTITK
jgi:hypothetical protein